MRQKILLFVLLRTLVALCLFGVAPFCAGQLQPASPPVADPKDSRFEEVTEDWTSPGLGTSHLIAARPQSTGIADHSGYTSEIVRVQWRFGDPIDLYVVRPKGVAKPPVVLYLYGNTTDTDRFVAEKFQKGATQNGFAAVGFVSALTGARYHDRPMAEWFVSDLQESLSTSAHDVQMVLNYLSARGDFDMNRVGMLGQDSGASIAILAAAVDPRIRTLDLVDPWGDWPDWLAGSPVVPDGERGRYTAPEFLKKVDGLDPVTWLPKVQAKIRLQDAVFLPSTPKKAKDKIRAAVPAGATVVVYQTPEDTREIAQGNKVLEWIQTQLAMLADSQNKPDARVAADALKTSAVSH